MNKTSLRDQILRQLRADLALQVGAAQLARDEAISEESRAENQYDTHSLEAGYLAEGQARQAAEIEENIALIAALAVPDLAPDAPIALGAFIGVEPTAWYFLAPRAGGLEMEFEGRSVLVVTPQSPLGRVLLGLRAGDTFVQPGRRSPTLSRIVSVC